MITNTTPATVATSDAAAAAIESAIVETVVAGSVDSSKSAKAAGKSKDKSRGKSKDKTISASIAAGTEGDTADAPSTKASWSDADEKRWNQIQRDRESGKLKGQLIEAVRKHAAAKVEDEDMRWAVVKKASDKTIWEIIQYCDYERGAINMVSRNLTKLAKPAKAEVAAAPADAAVV